MRKVSPRTLDIAQDAKYHFTINDLLQKENRQVGEESLLEMAETAALPLERGCFCGKIN